jgi:DNA-directed RNA polymerase specialized sigma24 family protein
MTFPEDKSEAVAEELDLSVNTVNQAVHLGLEAIAQGYSRKWCRAGS